MPEQLQRMIQPGEAQVNVTYGGRFGEMNEPISFEAGDGDVKTWVAEAIRTGSIPGIVVDGAVDLRDFVVERFTATAARPWATISVRPKTPFGR